MGKTFKYGYRGNSFRILERHAEEKINGRRRKRRILKDNTRAEITDVGCGNYNKCNRSDSYNYHKNTAIIGGYDSTALWNKSNANMTWENGTSSSSSKTGEFDELIGTTENGYSITFIRGMYGEWSGANYPYSDNISNGRFLKGKDRIGKKQLERRDEIGKAGL